MGLRWPLRGLGGPQYGLKNLQIFFKLLLLPPLACNRTSELNRSNQSRLIAFTCDHLLGLFQGELMFCILSILCNILNEVGVRGY